jgi:hypothetical protein
MELGSGECPTVIDVVYEKNCLVTGENSRWFASNFRFKSVESCQYRTSGSSRSRLTSCDGCCFVCILIRPDILCKDDPAIQLSLEDISLVKEKYEGTLCQQLVAADLLPKVEAVLLIPFQCS